MLHLICSGLAALITVICSALPSAFDTGAGLSSLPLPVEWAVSVTGVFGLFVDLPVFFGCLGLVLAWRSIWLVIRVYKIVLGLIPFLE